MSGNTFSNYQHILHISRAVFVRRCANSNELYLSVQHSVCRISSKLQPTFFNVALYQRIQTWLPNGQDAGFEAASAVISRLYGEMLAAIAPGQPIKDAKTRLQELLQGRRLALPKYSLIATEGEAHAQQFRIACEIDKLQIRTEGSGASRRAAEQIAAQCALERLQTK